MLTYNELTNNGDFNASWVTLKMSLKIAWHFRKRFGKSYYFAHYSAVLFDYYGIYKQQRKISITISKTSQANFKKFLKCYFFIANFIRHRYIATSVKDIIRAMLTVLPWSLWRLRYRWVKCGLYPALLPRILPVVTPAFPQARILFITPYQGLCVDNPHNDRRLPYITWPPSIGPRQTRRQSPSEGREGNGSQPTSPTQLKPAASVQQPTNSKVYDHRVTTVMKEMRPPHHPSRTPGPHPPSTAQSRPTEMRKWVGMISPSHACPSTPHWRHSSVVNRYPDFRISIDQIDIRMWNRPNDNR